MSFNNYLIFFCNKILKYRQNDKRNKDKIRKKPISLEK